MLFLLQPPTHGSSVLLFQSSMMCAYIYDLHLGKCGCIGSDLYFPIETIFLYMPVFVSLGNWCSVFCDQHKNTCDMRNVK